MSQLHDVAHECVSCGMDAEEFLRRMEFMISQVGFGFAPGSYTTASGEDVGLLYTVGMAGHGLPEVVVTGLPFEVASESVYDVAQLILEDRIRTNVPDSRFLHELDVYFVPVPATQAGLILEMATARAGAPVHAIQIV